MSFSGLFLPCSHRNLSRHIHWNEGAIALPYYLLLSRSITHAQRMSLTLERVGISGRIFRPPIGLTEKGCSYALRVAAPHFETAMKRLRTMELLPVRIFFTTGDGVYQEIRTL